MSFFCLFCLVFNTGTLTDCIPDHRPRDAQGGPAAQWGAHPCPTQRRPPPGGAETGGGQREALPGAFLRQQADMVRLECMAASMQACKHAQPEVAVLLLLVPLTVGICVSGAVGSGSHGKR